MEKVGQESVTFAYCIATGFLELYLMAGTFFFFQFFFSKLNTHTQHLLCITPQMNIYLHTHIFF